MPRKIAADSIEQLEEQMADSLLAAFRAAGGKFRDEAEVPKGYTIRDIPGWHLSRTRPGGMDSKMPAIQAGMTNSNVSTLFRGIKDRPLVYGKIFIVDSKDHHVTVELVITDDEMWNLAVALNYQKSGVSAPDPTPELAEYIEIIKGNEPEEEELKQVPTYYGDVDEDLQSILEEVGEETSSRGYNAFTKRDRHFQDKVYIPTELDDTAFRLIEEKVKRYISAAKDWHETYKFRGILRKPEQFGPSKQMSRKDKLNGVLTKIRKVRVATVKTREQFEKDRQKDLKSIEKRRESILKDIEAIKKKVGKWYENEYPEIDREAYKSILEAAKEKRKEC